jgi:predicted Zn-dependent protease
LSCNIYFDYINTVNLKRREFLKTFSCACCSPLLLTACSDVAITNRRQLSIYSDDQINKQALKAYETVKKKEKTIQNGKDITAIKEVGVKITNSVHEYFNKIGESSKLEGYSWEYILIDDPKTLNAWCMPGGKIAFYSGILEITQNNDGIAAVMGHEIAHAVARHSVERASQALAINIGTTIIDIALDGALSSTSADDYLVNLGISLPFSRLQESEADYLGLAFMTMAGYNNQEAVKIWERMSKANEGKSPPEFLSTHPSADNRIQKIQNWIPEINVRFS